jgi:glycosyltransferase involved in cell wall biosynthesis
MYNEELLLPMWIESWLKVPFINKIHLVDGGSTDRSVEIARSYDRVQVMVVPWKNDFARQRNIAIKLCKSPWVFQPDIDEMPCGKALDSVEFPSDPRVNQIIIPYIKFYDWNKLWFFKNNVPTLKSDMVEMAANKSTTTIFSKKHLRGYNKSLHEMPMISENPVHYVLTPARIPLDDLGKTFFMGHFDQAKHFEQARQNGTTVEYEMGVKRVRYRLISSATYSGKVYDQEWAKEALKPGNEAMIEELGREQLKSFMDEHFLLEKYNAFPLLCDTIKAKLIK